MSDVKRRKLNEALPSTPLSAIAARRAKAQAGNAENTETKLSGFDTSLNDLVQDEQSAKKLLDDGSAAARTPTLSGHQTPVILEAAEQFLTSDSRGISPEPLIPRPSIVFSTFRPSSKNIKELKDGTLALKLEPGERLVILGQYELCVQRGQISLLGYTLQPSKIYRRICSPSSHSLPVIRCASSEVSSAEVRIRQCWTGLESLRTLSALFGSLWDEDSGPFGEEYSSFLKSGSRSSYRVLFTSQDGPSKTYLQPLISPPEWNSALSRLSDNKSDKPSVIILCGPKSSGKSTFAKLLCNKLLSSSQMTKGVAILDLDPGQPEYSPPGQMSFVHVQEPNFGPPFSHPATSGKSKTIRSHSIGAITPSADPSLYMACALDLYYQYRKLSRIYVKDPLIINTSGWVLGTGLEILVELIAKVNPTEVIYMSLDGPIEVVESLREANSAVPVVTLPSQSSEYATRTSAHLRTMQNMSYFHLDSSRRDHLSWNDTPLTSIPPWQVSYFGDEAGIMGVLCYGEQSPANLLADTINGSLVSVVVIDSDAAIPGFNPERPSRFPFARDAQDNDINIIVNNSTSQSTQPIEPFIISTPEGIPYFNPANTFALDPKYSYSIGLALIRGIDTQRKCLQILTPVPAATFQNVAGEGKRIVLVSGKLDTPGWAYTEAFVQSDLQRKEGRRKKQTQDEEDEAGNGGGKPELGKEFEDAPWVERLHGSQGRGVGSRVWRVRRDLGKSEGGE